MNSSLKIGAVSGLVAGLVAGIVCEFSNQVANLLGLFAPYFRAINTGNMIIDIPVFGFWGVVLGIIYSRIYYVVPREGILKAVIYGLFIWFITKIRIETWELAYGRILQVAGALFYGFLMWLSYGLVLGILYGFLRRKYYPTEEKLKVVTYAMISGILSGAIAGFAGGFASSMAATVPALGLVKYPEGVIPFSFDFWLNQAGAQILLNLIWGTFFGFIYPRVYNLVPGEKVRKGLYYSIIVYMITSFLILTYVWPWAIFHDASATANYMLWTLFVNHGANAIVYGLVLGALYRK